MYLKTLKVPWTVPTTIEPSHALALRVDYLSLLAKGIDPQVQAEIIEEQQQIALDTKIWTIPAERMKAKREHIVPLSPQPLEILEIMKPISACREHVFPSRNNPKQSTNIQTANAELKRIGYGGKLVAHGLRSITSTGLNEQGFNTDIIEAALAHSDKKKFEEPIIGLSI